MSNMGRNVWIVTRVDRDEPNPAVIAVGATRAAAITEAACIEASHINQFWRDQLAACDDLPPDSWREDAAREVSVLNEVLQYLLSHPDTTEAYSPNDCRYIVESAPFVTI